jgi:hypothetical protein
MLRILPFGVLLSAALVFPAAAQERPIDHRGSIEAIADDLEDPVRIEAAGDMIEAMTGALLTMPVGPLAKAMARIDPDSELAELPEDATLADLTGDDADMPARLGDETRHAVHAMAGMTRDMAQMLPVFEAMARDMAAQWQSRIDRARNDER